MPVAYLRIPSRHAAFFTLSCLSFFLYSSYAFAQKIEVEGASGFYNTNPNFKHANRLFTYTVIQPKDNFLVSLSLLYQHKNSKIGFDASYNVTSYEQSYLFSKGYVTTTGSYIENYNIGLVYLRSLIKTSRSDLSLGMATGLTFYEGDIGLSFFLSDKYINQADQSPRWVHYIVYNTAKTPAGWQSYLYPQIKMQFYLIGNFFFATNAGVYVATRRNFRFQSYYRSQVYDNQEDWLADRVNFARNTQSLPTSFVFSSKHFADIRPTVTFGLGYSLRVGNK
jgi:hypothetical protein